MKTEVKEVCKITKNALGKHVYSITIHINSFIISFSIWLWNTVSLHWENCTEFKYFQIKYQGVYLDKRERKWERMKLQC